MTAPAFNDVFNPYYDQFSIWQGYLNIPSHFDVWMPDFFNEVDFQCLSVIAPNPAKGAVQWTLNGRWMTIGIYRDEGRATAQRPATINLSWSRTNKVLTITDPAGHRLLAGDYVDLYDINVPQLLRQPITILSPTVFTVPTLLYGPTSGSIGAYQPSDPYNFYEQNIVFRLLPSFQLVPWSYVQTLFASSAQPQSPQLRQIYNITTSVNTQVPRGKSSSTNYDVPYIPVPSVNPTPSDVRFNQVYDEQGNPLEMSYDSYGYPVTITNFDRPNLNSANDYNSPEVNPPSPARVFVYDFYGGEINDPARGPYFSTTLITRDTTVTPPLNNILRASQNEVFYYSGKLYDGFMNRVVGIQTDNATVVRRNLLPLELDRFNHPTKTPVTQTGRLQGF